VLVAHRSDQHRRDAGIASRIEGRLLGRGVRQQLTVEVGDDRVPRRGVIGSGPNGVAKRDDARPQIFVELHVVNSDGRRGLLVCQVRHRRTLLQ
jgi:hypothetical protein